MEWLSYLRELSLTVIGAALGFALAIYWDRRREAEAERMKRRLMLDSMLIEIETILSQVGLPESSFLPRDNGAIEVDLSIPFLPSAAFETAVHSGDLTLLTPSLQAQASSVYEHLRIAKLHVDNITTSYTTNLDPELVRTYLTNAFNYLRGHLTMIEEQLKDFRKELEKFGKVSSEQARM